MLLAHCQNVKKYHGAQLVLENVTFEIQRGERIGLVGRNGSGKSTLLRLIAKLSKPDEGQLTVRKEMQIGYLAQIPAEWEESTVYDALAAGCREVLACRARMTVLEEQMSQPEAADQPQRMELLLKQYAELQERFEREGGYELDARIDQVAAGMGVARDFYGRSFASLSGGEKTRIALASQLIGRPELLLLDEPTNHLDLSGTEWLEEYLSKYDGTCLIVSHDRYFLDRTVTKIVELEDGEAHVYHTNYSGFVREKEEKLLRQFADYQEQQKKIRKMKETIRQLIEWGRIGGNEKFFRRAASMQKALDRMERIKRPVLDPKGAEFDLRPEDRSGRKVLVFESVSKRYGAAPVLDCASGMLEYGEKVMVVGRNGSGKSTLLKLILGLEPPDGGTFALGSRVDIGYLAQQEYPGDHRRTVLDYFREAAGLEEGEARGKLASYLFYGADVFKSVSTLSGGEWTRLRLALLVQRKPNLLILDEPTNHMDIASREALEDALEEFPGTVLAVTHDRYFINRLSQKIWQLDKGRIAVFPGNFDEYKDKIKQLGEGESGSGSGSETTVQHEKLSRPAVSAPVVRAAGGARRERASSAVAPEPSRERLEQAIAREEERLAGMDARLQACSGDADAEELAALWAEREAAQERLDRLYEQWMQSEEQP